MTQIERFDDVIKKTGKFFLKVEREAKGRPNRWYEQSYIGKNYSRCFQGNVNTV